VDVQERAGRDEGVSVLSRSAVVDTKPRLREPCEEVRATHHRAFGHVLFSSDDRKTPAELITSVVRARQFMNDNAVGITDSDGV
jgi:hypothetical protein